MPETEQRQKNSNVLLERGIDFMQLEEIKNIFEDLYQKQKIELINHVGQDRRLGDLALNVPKSEKLIRKLYRVQAIYSFCEIMLTDRQAKNLLSGMSESDVTRAWIILNDDKSIIDTFLVSSYAESFSMFRYKFKEDSI